MMRFLKRVLLFFCFFSLPLFAEVKGKDKKLLNQVLRSIHKQRPLLVAQKKGPRKKIRPCVIKKNCPSLKRKKPGLRKKLGLKNKRRGLRKKLGPLKKRKDRLPPKASKKVRKMRSKIGVLQRELRKAEKDGNEKEILALQKKIKEIRRAMKEIVKPRLIKPSIIKKKQDK